MRIANQKDKSVIIQIITESFHKNPSVNWTVKQDHKKEKRYRKLATYLYREAIKQKAIYLSNNNAGLIIFYLFNQNKSTVSSILNKIMLIFSVVGISRTREILRREKFIRSKRPADGNFIYCWYFGVLKKERGKGAAIELKNYLFEKSNQMRLPIYMETTIELNKKIYERYGFSIFNTWYVEKQNLTYYFMRRNPDFNL